MGLYEYDLDKEGQAKADSNVKEKEMAKFSEKSEKELLEHAAFHQEKTAKYTRLIYIYLSIIFWIGLIVGFINVCIWLAHPHNPY